MLRSVVIGRMIGVVCGVVAGVACGRGWNIPTMLQDMPTHLHRHEDVKIHQREEEGRPFHLYVVRHHRRWACITTSGRGTTR